MRSFFAAFFGTLAALAVVALAIATTLALLVTGVSTGHKAPATFRAGSWLVFDLSDAIQDAPLRSDGLEELAERLGDSEGRRLQARRVVRAIRAAATDDDVAGLLLLKQEPALERSAGFATLQEIRHAVDTFRESGKPVEAYLTMADARDYYLASAASRISIDPFGALVLPGLAAQPTFYTGLFEKIGIGVQVTRVGRYKSAVEPFTQRRMSPESRAQTQKLLDDVWSEITASVERSRSLDAGRLQRAADSEGLISAELAVELGLADRAVYADEILAELRESTGAKSSKLSFHQVSMDEYAGLVGANDLVPRRKGTAPRANGAERLAIVYAEGAIVDGSGPQQGVVWSRKVARDLRRLRRDDRVKGVVLRVNSPGGSVTASEAIGREVRLMQEKKPVVVSMGDVAASGGYWISTYSDRIFAEPTTITGSIGVFGLLFNVQELAEEKLGLGFETVKTGRFADAMSVTRPKTETEMQLIQKNVDWVYDQFLSKVTESRGLDRSRVEEIAQGRVWSGLDAKDIGLVDEIGGLEDAIAFAADRARIGEEFAVVEYPKRRTFIETLTEALSDDTMPEEAGGAASTLLARAWKNLRTLGEFNDPRGVYARLPFELLLE